MGRFVFWTAAVALIVGGVAHADSISRVTAKVAGAAAGDDPSGSTGRAITLAVNTAAATANNTAAATANNTAAATANNTAAATATAMATELTPSPMTASSTSTAIVTQLPDNSGATRLEQTKSASLSCGRANRGALANPTYMPDSGYGYVTPDPWRSRDLRFGTDELVSLIERAAGKVADEFPGATLGVADVSAENGGAVRGHRSHQSGRDIDLIYYAMNDAGEPFYPDSHMAYYTGTGRAHFARSPRHANDIEPRYFDRARNWALVKALISDENTGVYHIFVSNRVRRWLLEHAETIGEDPALIELASKLVKRPNVRGHNDHMHVRIACSAQDIIDGSCNSKSARPPRRSRKWHSRIPCNPVRS